MSLHVKEPKNTQSDEILLKSRVSFFNIIVENALLTLMLFKAINELQNEKRIITKK